MNEKSKKILKTTTIWKWKENHPWPLLSDKNTLICTICRSQEEKLKLMPFTRMNFIKGSTNYNPLTLKPREY